MALSLANKHVINRIRSILSDKNDSSLSFEDKVLIANSALSEYSANVFNFKRTTISPQIDGKTYILPNDFEGIGFVKWNNTQTQLIEDVDFYIYEGNLVLNIAENISNSSVLDVLYDAYIVELVQETIGTYSA